MRLPDLELEGGEKGGTEWFKCSLDLLMEKSRSYSAIRGRVEKKRKRLRNRRAERKKKKRIEKSIWEKKI